MTMPILYKSHKWKIFTLWLYSCSFSHVLAACLPLTVAKTPPLMPEMMITHAKEIELWLKGKSFHTGQVRGHNRYGDGVATFFYEGKPVAEWLLLEGFGLLSEAKAEGDCLENLRLAQASAMREKRGIWAKSHLASDKTLERKIGQYLLIYDTVYSTRKTKGGHYLNFHANYRENLSGFITDRAQFDVTNLTGKTIYMHGVVSKQSGLSILVERAEQIIVP